MSGKSETSQPLTRLARRAIHPFLQGERGGPVAGQARYFLLPLWEKVPVGRMRGL